MSAPPPEGQGDIFAPPQEDVDRPVGTLDGPRGWEEGLCAGLRCWCGPLAGWRDLGELVGLEGSVATIAGKVVFHEARLTVSLTFDLGRHKVPRRRDDDEEGRPQAPEQEQEE